MTNVLAPPKLHATGPRSAVERTGMTQEWSIGNYLIIREIASGAQGKVYQAIDSSTGRPVALKTLHAHLASEPSFVERFMREAKTAQLVKHPNVVEIYDVGEIDGAYFIAMELLPYGLAEFMRRDSRMQIPLVARYVHQIAEALGAASAHGVVHRDIKPSNVLISDSGDAKLTDFGIAFSGNQTTIVADGSIAGTWYYMPPEQAQSLEVDTRSDIYSLGIMTFQMLTGRYPFQADTPAGLIQQHMSVQPPPINLFREDITEGFSHIVERCLAKSPDDRFQTAQELVMSLQQVFPEMGTARDKFPEASIIVQQKSAFDRWKDAVQYKPAVLAFAISTAGPAVVLLLGGPGILIAVLFVGFLFIGSLLTIDQYRMGSGSRAEMNDPPIPADNLTQLQLMWEATRAHMVSIAYLPGITAIDRLRREHLHVQSAAVRLNRRSQYDFSPLMVLAGEAYRRGLSSLAMAVNIAEIVQSTDIDDVEADIEATRKLINSSEREDLSNADRMMGERLERLEERLQVVTAQKERLQQLLSDSEQAEFTLFKTRADLSGFDTGSSKMGIQEITEALRDNTSTIKEVRSELRRHGILDDNDEDDDE